jgi:excisionase family DNA binding protein
MPDEGKVPDRLHRPEEVAERFRCSTQDVQRLVKDGAIKAVNVNNSIRAPKAEVERFLKLGWSADMNTIKRVPKSRWSEAWLIPFGAVLGMVVFGAVPAYLEVAGGGGPIEAAILIGFLEPPYFPLWGMAAGAILLFFFVWLRAPRQE